MKRRSPFLDDYYDGKFEKPLTPENLFGIIYRYEPMVVNFFRGEDQKNAGKDVSTYATSFEIRFESADFKNKRYEANIIERVKEVIEEKKVETIKNTVSLIGTFAEDGKFIVGIKFYATGGSYPISEEREIYNEIS